MYLNLLNKQEQKDFLELARYSIGLNGENKEEEEDVLTSYKFECQLAEYVAYRQDDIKKIITSLRGSRKKVKKIIIFFVQIIIESCIYHMRLRKTTARFKIIDIKKRIANIICHI